MNNKCKCDNEPFSRYDKAYLRIHGNCWDCDHRKWNDNKLSLNDFEAKETEAMNNML